MKLKNTLSFFFILVSTLLFTSSLFGQKLRLFSPENGNPIALWNKADFQIAFDVHQSLDYLYQLNTNLKLAYSPLDKIFVRLSLLQNNLHEETGFCNEDKLSLVDFGIGVYHAKKGIFKSKKRNQVYKSPRWKMQKGLVLNANLGYSLGRILLNRIRPDAGSGKFHFNRFYGQLGFQIRTGLWGFSGVSKLGLLNYRKGFLLGYYALTYSSYFELLDEKNNFFFWENSLRFFLGIRWGQIYIQKVRIDADSDFERTILNNFVSLGLALDIQKIFKKRKKKS